MHVLKAIEEPTLPLVWPAIMTLKYDLSSFSEESQFLALKTLASRALQLIERDFPKLIKDEHRTATFLNPKQRKLQHLLSPDEYEKVCSSFVLLRFLYRISCFSSKTSYVNVYLLISHKLNASQETNVVSFMKTMKIRMR